MILRASSIGSVLEGPARAFAVSRTFLLSVLNGTGTTWIFTT